MDPLFDLYNQTFKDGIMHETAREDILNLIPKKGKDARILKNLRTITLINVDYKIVEKCIAKHLQSVLPSIIHDDQTGFMSDRRMAVNVRRVLDIMNFCDKENKQAFILNIDFLKAFDKCEVSSVIASLEYFNFPDTIIKWIGILYNKYNIKVQNYGHFSEQIPVERSVHQGGCASAFLFNILVETMAIELQKNLTHSIKVEGSVHSVNQYADDTGLFSEYHHNSLKEMTEQLERFHQQSGLKISYNKSLIYRIGSLKDSDAMLYTKKPLAWTNIGYETLGIFVTHREDLMNKNFSPILHKMKSVFSAWQNRGLSLGGKIVVINSLISSLFVHKMSVLPSLETATLAAIDSDICRFLWNRRRAKFPLRTLQKSKMNGGQGLVNMQKKDQSLKISWLYILEKNAQYAQLAYYLFAPTLQKDIFRCNFEYRDVKWVLPSYAPPFWECVVKAWSVINYDEKKHPMEQLLWCNSLVRVDGKPIFWKLVYNRGLKYPSDLYVNGQIMTVEQARDRFGLLPLSFNSLKAAIPKWWRAILQSATADLHISLYDLLKSRKDLSRHAYQQLIDDKPHEETLVKKWADELGAIPSKMFKKQMLQIRKMSNIIKLCSFQYRLINKALVLNSHLLHWGYRQDNLCSFCGLFKETYVHLFVNCSITNNFWKSIVEWCRDVNEAPMSINKFAIVFNSFTANNANVKNFIGLTAKQYIYRQHCMQQSLSFIQFKNEVKRYKCIEKFNALHDGKVDMFYNKWGADASD